MKIRNKGVILTDQAVLTTQQWLNANYKDKTGYSVIPEDGVTGWTTVTALTIALQIELGISTPNGSFGPATRSAFTNLSISSGPQSDWTDAEIISFQNKIYILQGALFCKGYNPTGLTGTFGTNTESAVKQLQSDAGISSTGIVDATLMKALLSMDAFTILEYGSYDGDTKIRQIQQYLNKNYISNACFSTDIGLVPCDGIYGRSTNKALLYALQIEEGLTGVNGATAPNGVFGPTTKAKCPTIPTGTTEPRYVYLLQYALYCNGFDSNGFDGTFSSGTQTAVTNFQSFCALTADGVAGPKTWASLLVSTGDSARIGTACDCATILTAAKAETLVNNSYKYVGRYLTGKYAMTVPELEIIYSAGLSVIPIFEYGGYELSYFNETQGVADAQAAYTAADNLGFKVGSLIYFAVDFDAVDDDVTNAIIPYFKGIQEAFNELDNPYVIGIYGPRNVCKRVAKEGISFSSFVSDMSTGFSGNLGYSLPEDWTFDQISTITLGSGEGQIEIDNNIFSNKNYNASSNYTDWMTDAINRGWGPITLEEYYKRMATVFQDDISESITICLNNDSSSSFWEPGNSDFVALANALVNNTTYSVWVGDIKYDTTKPGFMRVYKKVNSQGTIELKNEYKLKSFSDVGERFVAGGTSGLKLEFLKAIDKYMTLGGIAVGAFSDLISLEEQGYVHSSSDYAAALAACVVQNGAVAYLAAALGSAVGAIITPEFPILGAIIGGTATAICGYFLSKALSSAELEQRLTNKLEWLFNKIF